MLLTDHVAKKNIVLDLKTRDKADAIEQLARLLLKGQGKAAIEATIEQLLTREAIESTGIGHGIAIPHARVAGLTDLTCAVAKLPKPLNFQAIDKKPVNLIFLICYPPDRQTLYLNFVATLARLLHDKENLDRLAKTESAAELFETLAEIAGDLVKIEEPVSKGKEQSPPPEKLEGASSRALVLLARLELCEEMLAAGGSAKLEIKRRIENISALLEPRILEHYRRLKKRPGPAIVVMEGGVCGGCRMKLPSQIAQSMRRQRGQVQLCSHCQRFVYQV